MVTRVNKPVRQFHAGTYQPGAAFKLLDRGLNRLHNLGANYGWLRESMRQGKKIFDIGRDLNRAKPSIYFSLERANVKAFGCKRVVVRPWRATPR